MSLWIFLTLRVIQKDGSAKYEANLKGAADYGWTFEELNQVIEPDIQIVQLGSLTSYVEPGATNVEKWFSQLRQSNKYLLTFDIGIKIQLLKSLRLHYSDIRWHRLYSLHTTQILYIILGGRIYFLFHWTWVY